MQLHKTSLGSISLSIILLSLFVNISFQQHPHFWAYGYTITSNGKPLPCWKFFNPVDYSDYCLPRYLKIICISYDNASIGDISGTEVIENKIRKPDGIIDIYDVVYVSRFFGTTQWDEMFDYQADVNGDGIIDIYDLITVSANSGYTCSWIPFSPDLKLYVTFGYPGYYVICEPDSNGVVEVPYDVPYPYTVHVFPYQQDCVNAFVLIDFGEVYPRWSDPYFEYGFDNSTYGVWHAMFGGQGITDAGVFWNPRQFRLYIFALGNDYYGDMSGTSILNGKMNAGTCTSLKYPYSFYGLFGHANNSGEAIIYYDAIPPLYINVNATLVHKEPVDPYKAELIHPRRITSGLVLMAWIDGFNDYDANVPYQQDQFITIEPQWFHQIWDQRYGCWVEDTFPPLKGSCYGDSSYHYQEQIKPKLNWNDGENLQFSLNMSAFIKRMFEYNWANALDIWYWYGLPEPQVLKNKRIIDVTDHIHIYAIHIYVEAFWAVLIFDFHEVSITNKPKYTVIGS